MGVRYLQNGQTEPILDRNGNPVDYDVVVYVPEGYVLVNKDNSNNFYKSGTRVNPKSAPKGVKVNYPDAKWELVSEASFSSVLQQAQQQQQPQQQQQQELLSSREKELDELVEDPNLKKTLESYLSNEEISKILNKKLSEIQDAYQKISEKSSEEEINDFYEQVKSITNDMLYLVASSLELQAEGKNERQLYPISNEEYLEKFKDSITKLSLLLLGKQLTEIDLKDLKDIISSTFEDINIQDFLSSRNSRILIKKDFDPKFEDFVDKLISSSITQEEKEQELNRLELEVAGLLTNVTDYLTEHDLNELGTAISKQINEFREMLKEGQLSDQDVEKVKEKNLIELLRNKKDVSQLTEGELKELIESVPEKEYTEIEEVKEITSEEELKDEEAYTRGLGVFFDRSLEDVEKYIDHIEGTFLSLKAIDSFTKQDLLDMYIGQLGGMEFSGAVKMLNFVYALMELDKKFSGMSNVQKFMELKKDPTLFKEMLVGACVSKKISSFHKKSRIDSSSTNVGSPNKDVITKATSECEQKLDPVANAVIDYMREYETSYIYGILDITDKVHQSMIKTIFREEIKNKDDPLINLKARNIAARNIINRVQEIKRFKGVKEEEAKVKAELEGLEKDLSDENTDAESQALSEEILDEKVKIIQKIFGLKDKTIHALRQKFGLFKTENEKLFGHILLNIPLYAVPENLDELRNKLSEEEFSEILENSPTAQSLSLTLSAFSSDSANVNNFTNLTPNRDFNILLSNYIERFIVSLAQRRYNGEFIKEDEVENLFLDLQTETQTSIRDSLEMIVEFSANTDFINLDEEQVYKKILEMFLPKIKTALINLGKSENRYGNHGYEYLYFINYDNPKDNLPEKEFIPSEDSYKGLVRDLSYIAVFSTMLKTFELFYKKKLSLPDGRTGIISLMSNIQENIPNALSSIEPNNENAGRDVIYYYDNNDGRYNFVFDLFFPFIHPNNQRSFEGEYIGSIKGFVSQLHLFDTILEKLSEVVENEEEKTFFDILKSSFFSYGTPGEEFSTWRYIRSYNKISGATVFIPNDLEAEKNKEASSSLSSQGYSYSFRAVPFIKYLREKAGINVDIDDVESLEKILGKAFLSSIKYLPVKEGKSIDGSEDLKVVFEKGTNTEEVGQQEQSVEQDIQQTQESEQKKEQQESNNQEAEENNIQQSQQTETQEKEKASNESISSQPTQEKIEETENEEKITQEVGQAESKETSSTIRNDIETELNQGQVTETSEIKQPETVAKEPKRRPYYKDLAKPPKKASTKKEKPEKAPEKEVESQPLQETSPAIKNNIESKPEQDQVSGTSEIKQTETATQQPKEEKPKEISEKTEPKTEEKNIEERLKYLYLNYPSIYNDFNTTLKDYVTDEDAAESLRREFYNFIQYGVIDPDTLEDFSKYINISLDSIGKEKRKDITSFLDEYRQAIRTNRDFGVFVKDVSTLIRDGKINELTRQEIVQKAEQFSKSSSPIIRAFAKKFASSVQKSEQLSNKYKEISRSVSAPIKDTAMSILGNPYNEGTWEIVPEDDKGRKITVSTDFFDGNRLHIDDVAIPIPSESNIISDTPNEFSQNVFINFISLLTSNDYVKEKIKQLHGNLEDSKEIPEMNIKITDSIEVRKAAFGKAYFLKVKGQTEPNVYLDPLSLYQAVAFTLYEPKEKIDERTTQQVPEENKQGKKPSSVKKPKKTKEKQETTPPQQTEKTESQQYPQPDIELQESNESSRRNKAKQAGKPKKIKEEQTKIQENSSQETKGLETKDSLFTINEKERNRIAKATKVDPEKVDLKKAYQAQLTKYPDSIDEAYKDFDDIEESDIMGEYLVGYDIKPSKYDDNSSTKSVKAKDIIEKYDEKKAKESFGKYILPKMSTAFTTISKEKLLEFYDSIKFPTKEELMKNKQTINKKVLLDLAKRIQEEAKDKLNVNLNEGSLYWYVLYSLAS